MESVIDWNGKAFEKTTKLKTLILENVYFSEGSKYLPSSLRILIWRGFPSKSLSSCLSNKVSENFHFLVVYIYKFAVRVYGLIFIYLFINFFCLCRRSTI